MITSSSTNVCLAVPHDDAVSELDRLFGARASLRREGSAEALSLNAVAGMLWLTMRTRQRPGFPATEVFRAYPSGGGLHSLRLYIAAASDGVSGLAHGLYAYEPTGHRLVLRSHEGDLANLLTYCSAATGTESTGAAILITSQIERVQAMYRNVAHQLVLLEAGALLQSLSLAGLVTGVGMSILGPCIPQALFSSLAGIDSRLEQLVGEVRLCSMRHLDLYGVVETNTTCQVSSLSQ